MKDRFRTFIGISLSSSVLTGIEKSVRLLKPQLEGVRWMETKNLHVTLKFLGDVPLNDLPQLIRAITLSVRQVDSFDLTFQGFEAKSPNPLRKLDICFRDWTGQKQPVM